MSLAGKRILITGAGLRPVRYIFRDKTTGQPSHTPVTVDGQHYKANLGAAAALECAIAGAAIHFVCRDEVKAKIIRRWIDDSGASAKIDFSTTDLDDRRDIERLIQSIPADLPLYWVQSLGIGAGTARVKDENPYLSLNEVSPELLQAELSVLRSTIDTLQALLPRMRQQVETRICVVSSMSAIRGYPYGSVHAAAKGAIARFVNSARLELGRDNIYFTDIRPGMVDTGGYDAVAVREANIEIGKSFGLDWSENMFAMPPTAVGKAIVTALSSDSNILSINMVARGQELNEQS